MSFLSSVGSFFRKMGVQMGRAFRAAYESGLTEHIVRLAIGIVKDMATSALTNTQKRETAVDALRNHGLSESIARLAVELAVQAIKKEMGI